MKFLRDSKIDCVDKEMRHHSIYNTTGLGIEFTTFTYENAGYMIGWELSNDKETIYGETIKELIDFLTKLIKEYDFKNHSNKCYQKDILVIYTDNIKKIKGFLQKYVEEEFGDKSFIIKEFIEFRDITTFIKDSKTIKCEMDLDCNNSMAIAKYAQHLIDDIFVPERYFYITRFQRISKRIAKRCHKEKNTMAQDIYPDTYNDYKILHNGYFGGLCYAPYTIPIEEDMIIVDRKSAYIYDMMIENHCISKEKDVDKQNWRYYLSSKSKLSFGVYKIKYRNTNSIAKCFKTHENVKVKSGCIDEIFTDIFCFTNIDLKNFINAVKEYNIIDIECWVLKEYEAGKLPDYMLMTLYEENIKKEESKDAPSYIYQGNKCDLNGIYGVTVKQIDSKIYSDKKKFASVAPQWGIWTTSYAKKNLLDLALSLEDGTWYYSDTDCIICQNNEYNRQKIREYNKKIRQNVAEFCNKYDFDFTKLEKLGQFCIEKEIKKFRSIATRLYMYTDKENNFTLKASGLNQDNEDFVLDEEFWYNCREPKYGKRKIYKTTNELTKCVINGKEYISDGSYYEVNCDLDNPMEFIEAFYDLIVESKFRNW